MCGNYCTLSIKFFLFKQYLFYQFIMNHSSLRIFTFSSELFNGYTVTLDIHSLQTQEDIIHICVQDLINTLQRYNFNLLVEKCKECNFHIHSHSYEQILSCNPNETIYICECDSYNN